MKAKNLPSRSKVDKVNGIDWVTGSLHGNKHVHSLKINRLRLERNRIIHPKRMRLVRKGQHRKRVREYRLSQQGRKQIENINGLISDRFFHYCEAIGTTPLQEFQRNNSESWINITTGGENQTSHMKQDKCPTTVLWKFRRHEIVNLI